MRKIRKTDSEYTSIDVHGVAFKAYVPEERRKGEINGFCEVTYSQTRSWGDRVIARFPLVSAWIDPSSTDAAKVCKATMLVPEHPADKEGRNAVKIYEMLMSYYGERSIQKYGVPTMKFSADDYGDTILYCCADGNYRAKAEGYKYTPIYNNKSDAFMAIINELSSYSSVSVAGIDTINLNNINDELLEEMGFIKVPDQMGVGVPMWFGDPVSIASAGRRSTSRWGYNSGQEEDSASVKEIAESLLDLIENDLSVDA